MKKGFVRIEGDSESPKVQKGMLVNLFLKIQKDLVFDWYMKKQLKSESEIHDELKAYLMNLYDEVCPESQAPFSKKFYEKTFDIWWEDGIEKALATNY